MPITSVPVFIAVNGVAVCLAGGVLCLWVWKGGNEYMRRMNILCSCKENSTPPFVVPYSFAFEQDPVEKDPEELTPEEERFVGNEDDLFCHSLEMGL